MSVKGTSLNKIPPFRTPCNVTNGRRNVWPTHGGCRKGSGKGLARMPSGDCRVKCSSPRGSVGLIWQAEWGWLTGWVMFQCFSVGYGVSELVDCWQDSWVIGWGLEVDILCLAGCGGFFLCAYGLGLELVLGSRHPRGQTATENTTPWVSAGQDPGPVLIQNMQADYTWKNLAFSKVKKKKIHQPATVLPLLMDDIPVS